MIDSAVLLRIPLFQRLNAGAIRELAARNGPIVSVQGLASDEIASGRGRYALERLVVERAVSTNTAAAGGNASLMAIG